jgi:hypothetical protein
MEWIHHPRMGNETGKFVEHSYEHGNKSTSPIKFW